MFNYIRKAGTTDVSVVIRIIDSTDGTPETGVVYNTSGIDLQYRREGATSTAITEATLAGLDSAHADGGFLHIGNGYYRLDLPDAACAAGAAGVLVHGIVTGMVVIGCYVQLSAIDLFDSVRMGLTALPNAAADAAGGLPISDAGGLDMDAKLANTNEVTAARMGALTDWINGGRLDLIIDIIAADVVNIDGAAMRGTDNAALASVCTEARLAELAAANLPADIDTLLTRIASALTIAAGKVTVGTNDDKAGYTIAAGGMPVGGFAAGAVTDAAVAADAEAAIAAAVLGRQVEAQGTYTLQQAVSIILAVLAGVTADAGATLKTPNGVATRVAATINASNERTAMTLTPSA